MEHFEIVAGTYEEFLLGYKFMFRNSNLVQSFASHDHSSSIRSLATSGHYLASGATDDRIIVYDLKARKEHCMLTHHNSTVNCLQFTNNHSHLISGSADGVLAIVKVGSWELEKVWEKAHKGLAILDIAIHPSGKLALTLGADCSLKTWNLIKGRQAFVINLNSKSKDSKSLDKILWAEDGVRFVLYGGKYTEIWSIESGGILKVIDHGSKLSSCIWFTNEELLVGYENGDLAVIETNTCEKNIHKAHKNRVKTLSKYEDWIISTSSAGEIKVWNRQFEKIASTNSGCRIICSVIVRPSETVKEEKQEETEVVKKVIKKDVKKRSVTVEFEEAVYKNITSKNKKRKVNFCLDDNMEKNKTSKKKQTMENPEDQTGTESIKKKKKKQKFDMCEEETLKTETLKDFPEVKIGKKPKHNLSELKYQKKSKNSTISVTCPKKRRKIKYKYLHWFLIWL